VPCRAVAQHHLRLGRIRSLRCSHRRRICEISDRAPSCNLI
jgi:hypothetical protein